MNDRAGRGLWEGDTPPVTAGPEKNLGGEAEINPLQRSAQKLLKNDGNSTYSWTLTCNLGLTEVRYPEEGLIPRHGNVIALVEWGQGAASFRAEVDMKTGAQFSVVATSITVSAMLDPDEPRDDGLILSARAAAAIVWGTRPGRAPCTRTQTRAIAAGDSLIVPVPPFADSLFVGSPDPLIMSGAAGPVTLNFLSGPAATDLNVLTLTNAAGFFQEYRQIVPPGPARFVEIVNGAGVPLDISLVWALSL